MKSNGPRCPNTVSLVSGGGLLFVKSYSVRCPIVYSLLGGGLLFVKSNGSRCPIMYLL